MTETRVKRHPRKGTKGVRQHSRSTPGKKKVPNTPKKRKSYKITSMNPEEVEDRLHSLFMWSGRPSPTISYASKVYNELGLNLPYQGFTRIGHVNRYAGLDSYYLNPNTKYSQKESVKFLKANLKESRPTFNRFGRDIIVDREYSKKTSDRWERGDQLIDEYSALNSEKERIKWIKTNLR